MGPTQMGATWNRPSPTELDAIRAALPLIVKSLQPAPTRVLARWVEYLLNRYPRKAEIHGEFAAMDKRMWQTVLGHWPEDVLEAAVAQWCAEERPYPPHVPGEVKVLGEPIMIARRALQDAGVKALGLPEPPVYVEASLMTKLFDAVKRGITAEVASVLKRDARESERRSA